MNAKLTFLLLAALSSGIAMGAEDAIATAQVRKVALFKNGYNWVEMSTTLPDAQRVRITGMPDALLGTVWWDAASGVWQLEGGSVEVESGVEDYSYADLLMANAGKQVKIFLKKERQVEGKLLPTAKRKVPEGSFPEQEKEQIVRYPQIFFVQTANGVQSVAAEDVASVDFAEAPQLPTAKVVSNIVTAQLKEPNPGAELRFGYVSDGMSWLPEYSLELGESGTANLTCRANIINEMADMKDVELRLVSGFPALGEAMVLSPLNRSMKLQRFLKELGILTEERNYKRSKFTANDCAPVACMGTAQSLEGEFGGGAGETGSKQVEDLFYYTLPHFSCERNKSILRELFTCEVPYSHVYTCHVPNQSMLERLSRNGEPVADVWHCVRLSNTSKQAWSTGIVTCTVDGQIAARSTLYFAAPSAETLLRLNKSMQARVQCSEELVKREERNAPGRRRDSVTVSTFRGTVTLKNSSDRPMELRLTKEVNGLVTEADKEGKINVSPSYSGNPRSVITWKFTVQPGEEAELTYTYEYEND